MRTAIIILVSALMLLFLLFLLLVFLIKPAKRRAGVEKFKGLQYAHRGLWDDGCPENSLSAHRRAADAGYAIELDVRLTSDGGLVVFHDETLFRMTKREGRVEDFSVKEITEIKLLDTEEKVPTFEEVLLAIGGRVPLLIELKGRDLSVADRVKEALSDYGGDFIIESFNPRILARVKKIMPEAIRGILSQVYTEKKETRTLPHLIMQCMLLNFLCRPDVIAYRHTDSKSRALCFIRRIFGTQTVAFTVKSEDEERAAYAAGFDSVVFEKYLPGERTYEI